MTIFLDVDGVLNTSDDWSRKVYSLNPKCVEAFCFLLDHVDKPKIVLSSTWRNGIARDGSTAVHIEELIKALSPSGITDLDRTAVSPDGSRSKEIDYYLHRHDADDYLILDDDPTLFELGGKTKNLYITDAGTGFTMKDAKTILRG